MKNKPTLLALTTLTCAATMLFISGCATTDSKTSGEHVPTQYTSTDGRIVEIGNRVAAEGGWRFDDPHLDKPWIASDFNFTGYDTIYIAPTLSTAKLHGPQDEQPLELAKENLAIELRRMLQAKKVFANVVDRDSDIKPGARTLKLENTIIEFAKGDRAGRYVAGLFGGGQGVIRVSGKMTDGDKTVFTFQARRSGTSAGSRLAGVFISNEDVQAEDIRSMTTDLSDFMAAIAGKFEARN
jgi:hypothetical protein